MFEIRLQTIQETSMNPIAKMLSCNGQCIYASIGFGGLGLDVRLICLRKQGIA